MKLSYLKSLFDGVIAQVTLLDDFFRRTTFVQRVVLYEDIFKREVLASTHRKIYDAFNGQYTIDEIRTLMYFIHRDKFELFPELFYPIFGFRREKYEEIRDFYLSGHNAGECARKAKVSASTAYSIIKFQTIIESCHPSQVMVKHLIARQTMEAEMAKAKKKQKTQANSTAKPKNDSGSGSGSPKKPKKKS